jgi:hypothetical protein
MTSELPAGESEAAPRLSSSDIQRLLAQTRANRQEMMETCAETSRKAQAAIQESADRCERNQVLRAELLLWRDAAQSGSERNDS